MEESEPLVMGRDDVPPQATPNGKHEPWQGGPPPGFDEPANDRDENSEAPPDPPCAKLLESVPPEWCTDVPPARKWLLRDDRRPGAPGLLPLGKAGMLIAEGGGSKTTLLVQLAIAVATGEPFLEWFTVDAPGRVLLIIGEEDREDMWRKVYAAAKARGSHFKAGMIVMLPLAGIPCALLEPDERGSPRESAFAQWLFSYLANEKFSLVVLDPLSRFAGFDAEKDNATATRYVQIPERIATVTGATVLTSHHIAQWARGGADVTATASRGSTAFTDGHRWVASLSVVDVKKKLEGDSQRDRLGEVVTLSFVKSNYSLKADPIQLRRIDGGALVPIDDEEASTIDRARSGAAQREAKAAEKEAGRRHVAEQRQAEEKAVAQAKAGEVMRELKATWEAREVALVRILWNHPDGIGTVDLRTAMVVALGSLPHGHDAVTVGRLGEGVRREPGPNNGKRHFLQPESLPEALRQRLSALAIQGAL